MSRRSAASVYGIGHLPADVHEFTAPVRKQSRRVDVRIHVLRLGPDEVVTSHGLPVTRPSRIASDLAGEREDPEAIAQIVVDAIRGVFEYPDRFAPALAPYSSRFGFPHGDGLALFAWFLDLASAPEAEQWLAQASAATTPVGDRTRSRPGVAR